MMELLKAIWNLMLCEVLKIGMRFEYLLYKRSFYLSFVKTLEKYIDIFQYDKKEDAFYMIFEEKYTKAIEKAINENKQFKETFSKFLPYCIDICKAFTPLYYKYLVKGIRKDFKNNKYISDIIDGVLLRTCSLKRNKLIDKYIIKPLKKLEFNNTEKDIMENFRRFILDSLIQFAKLDSGKMVGITFNLDDIDKLNKDELISIIFSIQLYQPIYIINNIINQEVTKQCKLYNRISNTMLHTLRNKYGMDLDIKNMPDYKLIELIMKI